MLYRLSYSLVHNPTESPGPGNTEAEHVGMHTIPSRGRVQTAATAVAVAVAIAAGGGVPEAEADGSKTETAAGSFVVSPADDGTILLSGSVATIRGTMLRWEPQEKKRTLGFWTKAEDSAEWTFVARASGDFDVEVLQGCGAGQGGSEMLVTLDPTEDDATTLPFVIEDTGGFQQFRLRTIGRLTIAAPGEHVLRVKPTRIAKSAACDIRQIRLVPVTN
jgi:hypothetical protein